MDMFLHNSSFLIIAESTIYVTIVVILLLIIYKYLLKEIFFKYLKDNKILKNDRVVGCKDRESFNKRIEYLTSENQNVPFAFAFIDMDGFRQINDQLGYDTGDELLKEFSKRLIEFSKGSYEIYRLGGDEFGLIFPNITTKKKLENLLEKQKEYMNKPYILPDSEIKTVLEYSVGVSIYPNDAKTKEELLACSDIAVSSVKENGKNGFCFNSPLLIKRAENKYKMEQSIKTSFENGDFEVDFQPRFGLKDKSKLWLVSLVYWNHPSIGKLKAEHFIKYIEELGLLTKLDELTLAKTCAKLKYFKAQGIDDVNIAVNMSINQLKRLDFVENICSILEEYKDYANDITLEINNLIDKSNVDTYKSMIEKLKKYGVNIAINNFEIIYDGINTIKQLPIDELKINCEFLKQNTINRDVLKYIVKIANSLEYKTTLIGIETKEQYDYAESIGIDKVQGNYISKVIDSENMLDNIKKYIKMKK